MRDSLVRFGHLGGSAVGSRMYSAGGSESLEFWIHGVGGELDSIKLAER